MNIEDLLAMKIPRGKDEESESPSPPGQSGNEHSSTEQKTYGSTASYQQAGDGFLRPNHSTVSQDGQAPPTDENYEQDMQLQREISKQLDGLGPFSVPDMFMPNDYSDAGNADMFLLHYRGKLLYTDAYGWLADNGSVWERSEHNAVRAACDFSESMLLEADSLNTSALQDAALAKAAYDLDSSEANKKAWNEAQQIAEMAEAYLKHAKKSRNEPRISAMMKLASHSFHIPAERLDADAESINTPAGIVSLESGAIRPYNHSDLCTRITAAAPGKQGAELWRSFVQTVTCGDAELEDYLQQVVGTALFGKSNVEALFFLFNRRGRNGKSTFLDAVGLALGDYFGTLKIDALTTERGVNRGAAMAELRGKRLVIASEFEQNQHLSVSMLKQICSSDPMTVEMKYHQPETVWPSHTVLISTNFLPHIDSSDGGTWRRLVVLPFNAYIPPENSIPHYDEILFQQAGSAILQWCIDGAVKAAASGFNLTSRNQMPDAVRAACDAYQLQENWVLRFLSECCIKDSASKILVSVLYDCYLQWATAAGEIIRGRKAFTDALASNNYVATRIKSGMIYRGMRLKTTPGGKSAIPCVPTDTA